MTRPTGRLLGTWERSNRRAWQRMPIWFLAGIICFMVSCYGLMAGSSLASEQLGASLLMFLMPFSVVFCPGFFVLLSLEISNVSSLPEGTLEVYTDGFIRKRKNNRDLVAYIWHEVKDCVFQSELADYVYSPEIDYSDPSEISMAIGSRIAQRGYIHGYDLICKTFDNYPLKIDASYRNVESLVQVLWTTLVEYWAEVIGKQIDSGSSVYFDSIEVSAEWIRQGNTKVERRNIESAYVDSRLIICGRTEKGRLKKFRIKPTVKNFVLFSIANKHIPKVPTEDSMVNLEDNPIENTMGENWKR